MKHPGSKSEFHVLLSVPFKKNKVVLAQFLTGHGLFNSQDLLKETASPISKLCRRMLNGKHNVNVSFDMACNFQAYQLTCSNFGWQQ